LRTAVALLLLLASRSSSALAQDLVPVVLQPRADTTGLPAGCAAATVRSVQNWFRALATGDTALVAAIVSPDLGAFSVSPFVRGERGWRGDSLIDLQRYARRRALRHETDSLHWLVITGWLPRHAGCKTCPRQYLGFVPVFYRTADDLPIGRHMGEGKAGYECGRGLWFLNVGPCRIGTRDQCASGDSAVVSALERSIEQATMRGDVAYLDSVYAPSFRFKHSTGTLEERGQRLAALRARRDTVFARDVDSLDVEVHGDIALSTGRIHVRQQSSDPRWREYTIRYVRVYVRRAGRWQLLTHHSTGESFGPLN